MPTEENKAIFRKFVEDVMNHGNLPVVDELFAPEFIGHIGLPPVPSMSREGVKALFSMYHYAFSDFHATIELLMAEGDKVVGLLTVSGTHTGNFAGISQTGKQVNFRTMDIFRLVDGTIVEHWAMPDQYSLRQQLGAIPPARK